MPVDARHRTAAMVRETVTSRDAADGYIPVLSERATQQTAMLALCDFQIRKLAYDTARIRLQSRSIFTDDPMAGSPWVNPEAIGDDQAYYGIMAPFIREQCGNVWQ